MIGKNDSFDSDILASGIFLARYAAAVAAAVACPCMHACVRVCVRACICRVTGALGLWEWKPEKSDGEKEDGKGRMVEG